MRSSRHQKRAYLAWEALLGIGIFALVALPLTGSLARFMLSLRSSEKLTQAPRVAEVTFHQLQASPQNLQSGELAPIDLGEKTFSRVVQVSDIESGTVVEVVLAVRDTDQPEAVYRYQTRMAKFN